MDSNKPHWVYVIQNSEGRFYIGISIDPETGLPNTTTENRNGPVNTCLGTSCGQSNVHH